MRSVLCNDPRPLSLDLTQIEGQSRRTYSGRPAALNLHQFFFEHHFSNFQFAPPALPPRVREYVRRMLEKLPDTGVPACEPLA